MIDPAASSTESTLSSTASYSNEPHRLSPEAEELLRGVPQFIGEAVDEQVEPGASSADVQHIDDPMAALMAQVAFEEQEVKDYLCEFFDRLSDRFDSDHWMLTDRQANLLAKPSAMMANALWAKLMAIMPDILGRWCESTPGASAFLLAVGIVVVPKVTVQVKLSRERKAGAKTMVQPGTSHGPVPVQPAAPRRGGMLYTEGKAE